MLKLFFSRFLQAKLHFRLGWWRFLCPYLHTCLLREFVLIKQEIKDLFLSKLNFYLSLCARQDSQIDQRNAGNRSRFDHRAEESSAFCRFRWVNVPYFPFCNRKIWNFSVHNKLFYPNTGKLASRISYVPPIIREYSNPLLFSFQFFRQFHKIISTAESRDFESSNQLQIATDRPITPGKPSNSN